MLKSILKINIMKVTSLTWLDYTIFGIMLGVSVSIGIYFGFRRKKENTIDEYLKGGKTMHVVPIAFSLIASQIATSTLLAVPADIYRFGANYVWLSVAVLIECFLAYKIFLPVFFKLQVTSVFEYLNLRFDKKLRLLASFFNLLGMFIYCPIVAYIPALAFSQVIGVNAILIATVSSALCVFYTAIGGFKAVVWSDALQFCIMVGSYLIMFCLGISEIGGFNVLWSTSVKGHRLDIFDFSFDPTVRDSFGSVLIGGGCYWLTLTSIDPVSVQKFLSVPKMGDVKKVMIIYSVGVALFHILVALTGLIIYTKYWNCDPLSTKEVSSIEQLVPYFVMEVAAKLVGYPGIFIAGVFSAGLSTLSASLNTMSAIIYEDFVSVFVPKNLSQKRISIILKLIVIVTGFFSTLLVFALQKINGIFPIYMGIYAATLGPTLGLYILGVLIPLANSKGAFYGGFFGIIFISYIFIQNHRHPIEELFLKPLSTEGCNISLYQNTTTTEIDLPFFLHRISFWLNTFIGGGVTVLVGVVISYFTAQDKHPVSKDLLTPLIHSFVKEPLRNNDQVELTPLEIDEKIRNTKT